jgi:hypothetical protein
MVNIIPPAFQGDAPLDVGNPIQIQETPGKGITKVWWCVIRRGKAIRSIPPYATALLPARIAAGIACQAASFNGEKYNGTILK